MMMITMGLIINTTSLFSFTLILTSILSLSLSLFSQSSSHLTLSVSLSTCLISGPVQPDLRLPRRPTTSRRQPLFLRLLPFPLPSLFISRAKRFSLAHTQPSFESYENLVGRYLSCPQAHLQFSLRPRIPAADPFRRMAGAGGPGASGWP